jgi:hypothetical protein
VDALLEEIDGVYAQWIPGSGRMEKQLRSIIFNVQFNTRSKSALAERSPDELRRGLDVVEYLSRYVAKNFEHVAKMYDKGEYENITEFISQEKTRVDKAGLEPATVDPEEDKIPEFDVPGKAVPGHRGGVHHALLGAVHRECQEGQEERQERQTKGWPAAADGCLIAR